ncbi:hypothetical protein AAFN86_21560 [Roseomonas sp. CAU 1739]|uniref:hypothetical protein n=1 Tax=Roseomonas sp. CAU 1739 TaxID=3140364 RepID=UPI00325AD258
MARDIDLSPQANPQYCIAPEDPRHAGILAGRTPGPGEELRHCRTDPQSWERFAGRMGCVILRNGKVVEGVGRRVMS